MLPASGRITNGNINVELNQTYSGQQRSLGNVNSRAIARIPSGQIALSDFYSRSVVDLGNIPGNFYAYISKPPVTGGHLVGLTLMGNTATRYRYFTNSGGSNEVTANGWTVDGLVGVDLTNQYEVTGRVYDLVKSGIGAFTTANSAPLPWTTISTLGNEFTIEITQDPDLSGGGQDFILNANVDITVRRIGESANSDSVTLQFILEYANTGGPPP